MQLLGFIFLAVLIFFTVFGNALVCLAIYNTRRLQTNSNLFIINMALGDIFSALSTLPLSMVLLCFRSNWPLGKTGNIFFDGIWLAFLLLSFINVLVITFERYIAIAKPFTYQTGTTKRRAGCGCLCSWIYVATIVSALVPWFKKPNGVRYDFLIPGSYYYPVLILHSSLAFGLVPALYAKMFLIARKHELEIIKQQDQEVRLGFYRQMKATRTVGLVIVLFFLVWLPFLINQFVDFGDIYDGVWDVNNSIMCYVTYCNGPVNILIYSWWNREIRRAVLKLLSLTKSSRVSFTSDFRPADVSAKNL